MTLSYRAGTLRRGALHMLLAVQILSAGSSMAGQLPDGFVYVDDRNPGIMLDIRYYTDDNFTGRRVDGYQRPVAILTQQAASALQQVAADLQKFGLGLKIHDAYRPQRAVDDFLQWAADLEDQRMKSRYYPDVDKANLFRDGYIAARSGHSRGSTLDLTLVYTQADGTHDLDMGTRWDHFGPESWPDSKAVTALQRAHRMLLRMVMGKHGFKPLAQEWWHFTLRDEPFPDTYFNFPVQ